MLDLINNSKKIERILFEFLNSRNKEELDLNESVRAIGDKIPFVLGGKISSIFNKYIAEYEILSSSKKICNVFIRDKYGNKYFIDIITHNTNKSFVRPNITTVKTIEKLYNDPQNIFLILLVHYNADLEKNFITGVQLFPIEWVDWSCLDIGALGNGQIQIKNSNEIIINKYADRHDWNEEFKKQLMLFYRKQETKIRKRISQLASLTLI